MQSTNGYNQDPTYNTRQHFSHHLRGKNWCTSFGADKEKKSQINLCRLDTSGMFLLLHDLHTSSLPHSLSPSSCSSLPTWIQYKKIHVQRQFSLDESLPTTTVTTMILFSFWIARNSSKSSKYLLVSYITYCMVHLLLTLLWRWSATECHKSFAYLIYSRLMTVYFMMKRQCVLCERQKRKNKLFIYYTDPSYERTGKFMGIAYN